MHDIKLAHNSLRAQIGLQTKVPIESKPLEPLGGSLTQFMDLRLYLVNKNTSPYLSDVNQKQEFQNLCSNSKIPQNFNMQDSLSTTPKLNWFDHETEF